jgi:predicted transcriptional regulator
MINSGSAKWNGELYAQDRRAAGYVAQEVSDIAGISTKTLGMYEHNRIVPDVQVASMLADALGYEVTRYINWVAFG